VRLLLGLRVGLGLGFDGRLAGFVRAAGDRLLLVEEPGLDRLVRPQVPALAHAGALAHATAQVVQLGPPHVAARGHLDALDLRRMHRNVRSTPTPNDCFRTVNVSRTPWPWRLRTTPSKTCVRRREPSMT
jgi:hypothetical protein